MDQMEAFERRQQREAKRRERELALRMKEMAKLSALEQAKLEVEAFENALNVLLTIHKEQGAAVDWLLVASSLPPCPPSRCSHIEFRARQRLAIAQSPQDVDAVLEQARLQDDREYEESLRCHAERISKWERMNGLATRILAGDFGAYVAAVEELMPFEEVSNIGSALRFCAHSAKLAEITLVTNGRKCIPAEVKTLTAAGKVSVKAMPKSRFLEVYQDYACGCVLRAARELFAVLPIDTLLITATAEILDTSTGQTGEKPFLSVAVPRATMNALNFDTLDPSDAVLAMTHRGDLKASRKTGDFEAVTPLSVGDIPLSEVPAGRDFGAVLGVVRRLRGEIAAQTAAMFPAATEDVTSNGDNG